MAGMTETEVRAIVGAYIREAEDHVQAELLDWMQDADDLFLGNKLGNEVEGRSQVVDRTTLDAIEWAVPQLMRMFHGSDQPVAFEPAEPGDEAVAQQATEYVTYIYNRDNPGPQISETVLRSGLLYRYGVVKRWWDTRTTVTEEDLQGLTIEQLTTLLDEDGVELVGDITAEGDDSDEEPGGMTLPGAMGGDAVAAAPPMAPPTGGTASPPQMPPAAMGAPGALPPGAPMAPPEPQLLYSVRIKRTTTKGRECIEAVPLTEFLVDKRAKRLEDATLVGHRKSMTRSELVALGYDRKLVDTLPFDGDEGEERTDPFDAAADRDNLTEEQRALDRANRLVSYYELYICLDEDDDGIAERRLICCAGKQATVILKDEITDGVTFHGFTPSMLAHRLVGLSMADKTKDIQILKTTIQRQMLDGLYLSTSPVTDVATGALDPAIGLDDFLVRRPGGIRRARDIGGIRESVQQWGGAQAFPMLEYLDQQMESRTGVSRQAAALSPDLLNPNVTAANGALAVTSQQAMLELVARRFAEDFLKPLFLGILRDAAKYQDKARMVRLRGQFVEMDPRSWNVDMDVTVQVGLGTAAQDKRLAALQMVYQVQTQIVGAGNPGGMVTPDQVHNTLEDFTRAAELGSVDRYFKPPTPPDPNAPPPPDPAMAKVQGELQIKQQETQAKLQADQAKGAIQLQQDQAKGAAEMQMQRERMQQEAALAERRLAAEMALAEQKMRAELALREREMAMEYELKKLQIAMTPAVRTPGETNVPRQ